MTISWTFLFWVPLFSVGSFVVPLNRVSTVSLFLVCSFRTIPSVSVFSQYSAPWCTDALSGSAFDLVHGAWWGTELLCHTISVCKVEDYVFEELLRGLLMSGKVFWGYTVAHIKFSLSAPLLEWVLKTIFPFRWSERGEKFLSDKPGSLYMPCIIVWGREWQWQQPVDNGKHDI